MGVTSFQQSLYEELTNKNAKAEVVFEEETDSDKKIAHTVKVDHRVFRYRASDPEGHRVVCMHNAKQGTVQSGDVLIFDDYEKVFSTFSEGLPSSTRKAPKRRLIYSINAVLLF